MGYIKFYNSTWPGKDRVWLPDWGGYPLPPKKYFFFYLCKIILNNSLGMGWVR